MLLRYNRNLQQANGVTAGLGGGQGSEAWSRIGAANTTPRSSSPGGIEVSQFSKSQNREPHTSPADSPNSMLASQRNSSPKDSYVPPTPPKRKNSSKASNGIPDWKAEAAAEGFVDPSSLRKGRFRDLGSGGGVEIYGSSLQEVAAAAPVVVKESSDGTPLGIAAPGQEGVSKDDIEEKALARSSSSNGSTASSLQTEHTSSLLQAQNGGKRAGKSCMKKMSSEREVQDGPKAAEGEFGDAFKDSSKANTTETNITNPKPLDMDALSGAAKQGGVRFSVFEDYQLISPRKGRDWLEEAYGVAFGHKSAKSEDDSMSKEYERSVRALSDSINSGDSAPSGQSVGSTGRSIVLDA